LRPARVTASIDNLALVDTLAPITTSPKRDRPPTNSPFPPASRWPDREVGGGLLAGNKAPGWGEAAYREKTTRPSEGTPLPATDSSAETGERGPGTVPVGGACPHRDFSTIAQPP